MPTVPKITTLEQTRAAPVVYQSPNAPARAFGPEPVGGEALTEIGNSAAAAANNIARQRAAVARTREFNEFRTKVRDQFVGEQTAGSDFSNPENVRNYETAIRAASDELIQKHGGGDESRAILSQAAEQEVQRYLDLGAARGLEANKAQVIRAIGETMNEYATTVANDPSQLPAQMQAMAQHVTQFYGDVLTPEVLAAQIDAGRGQLVTEAVNVMLAKPGGIDAAAQLMLDPNAINALQPQQRVQIRNRILESQNMSLKARAEGQLVRSKLAGALGISENQVTDDMVLQAMKITSKTPEDVVKTVGPDGKPIYTKKSEAPGKEAVVEKGVTVDLGSKGPTKFRETMGKLEAERVDALAKGAAQAQRDLDEIQRIKAALSSGQFKTGSFANQRLMVSRLAEFLGVPQDNMLWEEIGKASTADTLDAAMSRLAVSEAEKLGRITNMSLQFIRDSLPNLIRTPDGNTILVEVMERAAGRQIQLADLAQEYARKFDTLNPTDEAWAAEYPNIPRMSFSEAQAKLEKQDPVVNEELRAKMADASKKAPKSMQEAIDNAVPDGLPKGSRPTGRVRKSDQAVEWILPDGSKRVVKRK